MVDQNVRDRVVGAADRLFYGQGITRVGMDAVRAASGVSLKAIYKEFPSKEDLVLAVLDGRHEMWTSGVEGAVSRIDDPRERLLAIYDHLAAWFTEDDFRGCGFINAFGELGASSSRIAEAVREHKRSFQEYVDQLVADAGGPPSLAAQLVILAEGAQTTAAIAGTPDAAATARDAAALLIKAALD
jgi:AcrR family transcriptional regulator